jgi:IrrE N-terminal-like domain
VATLITSARRTTRRRQGRAIPEVLLALLLGALPSSAGEGGLEALAHELLPTVAKTMGLPIPKVLKVEVLAPAAAKAKLQEGFARDYPGDALARLAEALTVLGIEKSAADFPALASSFYASNADGFFEPESSTLFLVEGHPLERQRHVIVHELAHAVQFAQPELQASLKDRGQSEDERLAQAAALEGQAQAVTARVLSELFKAQGLDPKAMQALITDTAAGSAAELAKATPSPWLGLQLQYPYTAGAKLVSALGTPEDPLANALLARLPESTAEASDPARYRAAKPPERWGLGLGRRIPNATSPWSNKLGCAALDLLGKELCAGWVADAVETVRRDGKTVLVWMVIYEKPEQAKKLHKLLQAKLKKPGPEVLIQGVNVAVFSNVPADGRKQALTAANQVPRGGW